MATLVGSVHAVFPRQAVELVLRDELTLAAETEAAIHGLTLPTSRAAAALAPIPMDSLVVVDLLCAIEPVLGFSPPDATVRAGGYRTIQDAVDHLLPKLETFWKKKNGIPA